ncbi:sensor histidine kinase [Rhodothermus bifroesti]|uniref:sensor histidine kinase n=1 Tax=Rhodothermus bifroesti TaxID=2823335 RepID=UPI001F31DFAF|nr:sensor histidine kinase [Rhodothermus bifroesti]
MTPTTARCGLLGWGKLLGRSFSLWMLLTFSGSVGTLYAQEGLYQLHAGFPLHLVHYGPETYGQFPQNWAVVQDHRGVIYVANYDGILEFDGVRWRLLPVLSRTVVRSLDVDASGRLYVGAQGEFGYVWTDSLGTLRYTSLVQAIADSVDRDFWDVWSVRVTPEGVYFQTHKRLFLWDGSALRVWRASTRFHTAFAVRGRFYVRQDSIGLQTIKQGRLHLVPRGEHFAHRRIYAMMPYGTDQILIATREDGLWLYDGQTLQPFPSEADPLLRSYPLYHGCAMPGGFYALATLGGGVVVIDRQGRLMQVINETAGLPDGWVNYVYTDRQGSLWMALNSRGLARADAVPYLSVFDKRLGLEGFMYQITYKDDTLYAATSTGLFYRPMHQRRFEKIDGIGSQVFGILYIGDQMIIATGEGLRTYKRPSLLRKISSGLTYSLSDLNHFIAVGSSSGLLIFRYNSDTSFWYSDLIKKISLRREVLRVVQENHTLWLSLRGGRVAQLQFPQGWESEPIITEYGLEDGLPGSEVQLALLGERVLFFTKEGIFRFNPDQKPAFQPYEALMAPGHEGHEELLALVVDFERKVWLVFPTHVDIARLQPDGSYRFETPLVLHYPSWGWPVQIFVDREGIVWIGNRDQLIRYDPRLPLPEGVALEPPSVLIRRITSGDRVLFGGTFVGSDGRLSAQPPPEFVLEVPYAFNDLHFEFALPSFIRAEENRYQFRLEGVDEGWSDWTAATQRLYPNLWEGTYRFHVRARNAWGFTTPVATIVIRVLPPWYRTWWAYMAYVLLTVTTIGLAWRHYRVQQAAQRIQQSLISEDRINYLTWRVQELSRQLRDANAAKETLLSTTSHELRTPLSSILGFAAVLKEETDKPHHHEFLELIEESGQRLLETINAILDLAQLRAGAMMLHRVPVDVGEKVQEVHRLMSALAQKKGLTFTVKLPETPVYAMLDPKALERVLINLVSNAIKFTEAGSVEIVVDASPTQVAIAVRDTGVGIAEEFMPHLFEEFRQESSGLDRAYEGSGLGLAIVAQLVRLMEGTVTVQSKKGEGSTFTVTFARVAVPTTQSDPKARAYISTS